MKRERGLSNQSICLAIEESNKEWVNNRKARPILSQRIFASSFGFIIISSNLEKLKHNEAEKLWSILSNKYLSFTYTSPQHLRRAHSAATAFGGGGASINHQILIKANLSSTAMPGILSIASRTDEFENTGEIVYKFIVAKSTCKLISYV